MLGCNIKVHSAPKKVESTVSDYENQLQRCKCTVYYCNMKGIST